MNHSLTAFAASIILFAACKKDDDPAPPSGGTPAPAVVTVADIDGQVYATVVIGGKRWLKENLRTVRYKNGDPIPTGLDSSAIFNSTSGTYAFYANFAPNNAIYGKLYNYYAVSDPRGLCPYRWHTPSDTEWNDLEIALGMTAAEAPTQNWDRGEAAKVGGKLRGLDLWTAPNTNATNSSGFTALPGGAGFWSSPMYLNQGFSAEFLTATSEDVNHAWGRKLFNNLRTSERTLLYKKELYSCRCIED